MVFVSRLVGLSAEVCGRAILRTIGADRRCRRWLGFAACDRLQRVSLSRAMGFLLYAISVGTRQSCPYFSSYLYHLRSITLIKTFGSADLSPLSGCGLKFAVRTLLITVDR